MTEKMTGTIPASFHLEKEVKSPDGSTTQIYTPATPNFPRNTEGSVTGRYDPAAGAVKVCAVSDAVCPTPKKCSPTCKKEAPKEVQRVAVIGDSILPPAPSFEERIRQAFFEVLERRSKREKIEKELSELEAKADELRKILAEDDPYSVMHLMPKHQKIFQEYILELEREFYKQA